MAPHPWDKKYVRQTSNTGMEVALVRRGPTNSGTWIVLQPDKQLRSLRLNDRQTVLSQAPTGTYFRPLGKLTDAQKRAVKEAADQAIRSEETVPKMVQRFEGEVSGSRRFFALLSAAPALGGKTIRWITRSRFRALGTVVSIFLLFEMLQTAKLFHWNGPNKPFGTGQGGKRAHHPVGLAEIAAIWIALAHHRAQGGGDHGPGGTAWGHMVTMEPGGHHGTAGDTMEPGGPR